MNKLNVTALPGSGADIEEPDWGALIPDSRANSLQTIRSGENLRTGNGCELQPSCARRVLSHRQIGTKCSVSLSLTCGTTKLALSAFAWG